jgi:soluble lytic murein transglycosylase
MKPLLYLGACLVIIVIVFTATLFTVYPLKYKKYIIEAADLYNVDRVLIASVINAESSFRKDAISNKGAVGLMQIMPTTGEWVAGKIGIEFTAETLTDPRTNILIGTFYLNYLITKFGDTRTALIAYNAGEGKVRTWLAEQGALTLTTCPYPVTNRYADKVSHGMRFYRIRLQ